MTGRDLIPAPAPPLEGDLLAPNPTPAQFVDAIVRQCEDALDLERGDLMRPPPIEGEVVGKAPRRLSLQDWAEENALGAVLDLAPGEEIQIVTESPPCQDFAPPYSSAREALLGMHELHRSIVAAFCLCGCLLKPLDRECPACRLPT